MKDSTETLVKYYDAISKADLEKICQSFDIPSKLISLYGVVNITSREDIISAAIESSKVAGSLSKTISFMATPLAKLYPKSPCKTPLSQFKYLTKNGSLSPRESLIFSRSSGLRLAI